ncbi:MAG: hypothetical protein DDG60_03925 [Anaerolineae bacterium]|nr:MAG: hypothetical protein DDG60_03925 [Anaerolineae bacterium]
MKPLLTTLVLFLLALVSACAPASEDSRLPAAYPNSYPSYPSAPQTAPAAPPADFENPYAPQPDDVKLQSGPAYVENYELQTVSTLPPEYRLVLSGNLPTPCHALRIQLAAPDAQNNLRITVYSVADPNMMCTQVLEPFQAELPIRNLIPGRYKLWLNDQEIAEIDG